MHKHDAEEVSKLATFGRRKGMPRVCIADAKQCVRAFLGEALEELGFVTCECGHASELPAMLKEKLLDLIVIGFSAGRIEAGEILKKLAAMEFGGRVLLLGPRESLMVVAVQELGEQLGVAMLPALPTPFRHEDLRRSVGGLVPAEPRPSPPVDVAEALHAGWFELWYQPKIDVGCPSIRGAEALIRIRHPTWGIVPPARFMPSDGDPHVRALSEFVIGRAVDDWRNFVSRHGHVELAINLPITFLQHSDFVSRLCHRLPDHPAFEGLLIEIDGVEIIRNLQSARELARQLRFHKIGISIDDLGAEWPALMELQDFPFVEIKVDRKFVAGCADDRLKQVVCRRILELADGVGARTVAEGVETQTDFLAVREMGFALAQGFHFAKPMPAGKFARTMLGRPLPLQQ
jgi:EAL domain-containing protein (putative c-di-GMP-specific phosphodiesterase class I)/CheY-like chemotaxis protein